MKRVMKYNHVVEGIVEEKMRDVVGKVIKKICTGTLVLSKFANKQHRQVRIERKSREGMCNRNK